MATLRPVEPLDAIVVGRLDQGEEDRVLRLLTAERGLVSVWANRARRARSPFGALDLGVRAHVGVRTRGASELATLMGAEVVEARIGLRGRLERLGPAALACEVAGGLATAVPDPRLFGCLETALMLLDRHPDDPAPGFVAALLAKLLTFAGVAPALERCVACGGAPSEPMAWVDHAGGAFHVAHLTPDLAGAPRIDPAELSRLAALRRAPLLDAYAQPADAAPLLALVEAQLGHAMRARVWLQA